MQVAKWSVFLHPRNPIVNSDGFETTGLHKMKAQFLLQKLIKAGNEDGGKVKCALR